jgi:hypothetical protein
MGNAMTVKKLRRSLLTAQAELREPAPNQEVCSLPSKDVSILCQLLSNPNFLVIGEDGTGVVHCCESDDETHERGANEVSENEMIGMLRKGVRVGPHICRHLVALHVMWEGDQENGRRDRARLVSPKVGAALDAISGNLYFAAGTNQHMLLCLHDDCELLSDESN